MNVTFFRFQKKLNSTKVPTGGVTYDCILKETSGAINPTIILKWTGSGTPAGYNMARIGTFNRYYWIDEWTYSDRCWIATMRPDVLATLKPVIAQSSKYVLRSASEFDRTIPDNTYPAKSDILTYWHAFSLPWAKSLENGRFVVGIVGQNNTFSQSGVGYVVCTGQQLQQIISACFTETERLWTSQPSLGNDLGTVFSKYGEKMVKSITQPIQFINSVVWLPFIPSTSGSTSVTLGAINTGISVSCLGNPIYYTNYTTGSILPFSLTANDGYWKAAEPYVRYTLVCPPFGSVPLNGVEIAYSNSHAVSASFYVDCLTGAGVLEIAEQGIQLAADVGIQIQLAGNSVDYAAATKAVVNTGGGIIGGILKGVGNLLTGNVGGAIQSGVNTITGAASGIIDSATASSPHARQGSIGGGLSALNAGRGIYVEYYPAPEEDNAERGKPLCKVKTLGSLSGFIMCADGHLDAELTSGELAEAERYLTGGFFYE